MTHIQRLTAYIGLQLGNNYLPIAIQYIYLVIPDAIDIEEADTLDILLQPAMSCVLFRYGSLLNDVQTYTEFVNDIGKFITVTKLYDPLAIPHCYLPMANQHILTLVYLT